LTKRLSSFAVAARLAVFAAMLLAPANVLAHGAAAGGKAISGEAEIKQLATQPARVLAQQALVTLRVGDNVHDAEIRLDAALMSKERSDVDFALLQRATETLDGGNPEGAIGVLDQALSRPLGSDSGKALHESGREFTPEFGPQEVVGTVLGGVLLLLGAFGLWRSRRAGLLRREALGSVPADP